jgi:hypothetical protein
MKDKGKLLFKERVPKPLPGTNFRGLRGVIVFRFLLTVVFVGVFLYLTYLILSMPSHTTIMSIVTFALVILMIFDSQMMARYECSARPIQIHEKGISMPTTWFQMTFLKRGFIPWEEVKIVLPLNLGSKPEECGIENPQDAIVVISRGRVTYNSWLKNPREIQKALEVISRHWPKFTAEKQRIERLVEKNPSFSKGYASIDPVSLIRSVAILDGFLLTAIGIAILLEVDFLFVFVVVLFIVAIDLVVGLALTKVRKAVNELLSSTPT